MYGAFYFICSVFLADRQPSFDCLHFNVFGFDVCASDVFSCPRHLWQQTGRRVRFNNFSSYSLSIYNLDERFSGGGAFIFYSAYYLWKYMEKSMDSVNLGFWRDSQAVCFGASAFVYPRTTGSKENKI